MIRVHYFSDKLDGDQRADLTFPVGENADRQQAEAAARIWNEGHFQPVAEIATDDLNRAYQILQNGVVSPSWSKHPPVGLTPLVEPVVHNGRSYGWRSSMMGDVFEKDGEFFVVARFGFTRIETISKKEPT